MTRSTRRMLALMALAGCGGGPPPPPAEPPPPHFDGFDNVWRGALAGDTAGAKAAAREMVPGDEMTGLSGALAYVQIAMDADETLDGAVQAAMSCGACHRERGIVPLIDRPPATHAAADGWILWGLVWDAPPGPAVDAPELAPIVRAWAPDGGADVNARAEALVAALRGCRTCHLSAPTSPGGLGGPAHVGYHPAPAPPPGPTGKP